MAGYDLLLYMLKIETSTGGTSSMPFLVFLRDHLQFGIICGPVWGLFPARGLGIICGVGSLAALYRAPGSCLFIEKFPFLVLPRNTIMLQHLTIQFLLYYLSSGWEIKNKRKVQTSSSSFGY